MFCTDEIFLAQIMIFSMLTHIFFPFQKAFDQFPDKTAVCKAVKTNLRAEMSSVPEYLLSRSTAGKCG